MKRKFMHTHTKVTWERKIWRIVWLIRPYPHICSWVPNMKTMIGKWQYNFYHPPKKLQEGNVFSLFCLSVIPPTTQTSYIGPPTSDIWWPSLETCSNFFIGPHCRDTQWYWHLVVIEALMVGRQIVRILLECFLLVTSFCNAIVVFTLLVSKQLNFGDTCGRLNSWMNECGLLKSLQKHRPK